MKHLLVAGFDFGTSYSKVVLREQMTDRAKPVTFDAAESVLFPSFVRIGRNSLFGPDSQDDGIVLPYPKLLAADAASGKGEFSSFYDCHIERIHGLLGTTSHAEVASMVLTRYFLSVLNAIHGFIQQDEDWSSFDASSDHLVVQLAVPAGLSASDGRIDEIFQTALAAATLLRKSNPNPATVTSVEQLRAVFEEIGRLDSDKSEVLNRYCATYPEVAAGVQTVLRSPNTPDGRYITLDIGAGTVDLNAFYRRSARVSPTNPGLDYWACEVRPLGFARLEVSKFAHTGGTHEVSVNTLPEAELMKGVASAVSELMKGAFRYQPNRIRGNGLPPWSSNTIAYIWGGGAEHKSYEETFLLALRTQGVGLSSINRLPIPTGFKIPAGATFGRLAVAFGLSFLKANLEKVRLPHQIRTFEQSYPDYWQDVIPENTPCSCWANPSCLRCYGTGFISAVRISAPAVRAFLPPVVVQPQEPKAKPNPLHIALKSCLDDYIQKTKGRILLIERMLLVQKIHQIRSNRAFNGNELLAQEATHVLQDHLRQFGGKVRVLRFSAQPTPEGCWCLALRDPEDPVEDVHINTENPFELEEHVNREARRDFLDLGCGLRLIQGKGFCLELTSLNPKRKPPRVWVNKNGTKSTQSQDKSNQQNG